LLNFWDSSGLSHILRINPEAVPEFAFKEIFATYKSSNEPRRIRRLRNQLLCFFWAHYQTWQPLEFLRSISSDTTILERRKFPRDQLCSFSDDEWSTFNEIWVDPK